MLKALFIMQKITLLCCPSSNRKVLAGGNSGIKCEHTER